MKLGRNIGSVTIPKRPATVGGLIGWARGVNRALQELRDRKVAFAPAKGRGAKSLPLTIRQGSAVDKFQIVPGYVNSLMPTLGGTALDNSTPPEITVAADTWIWIKVVGTFGEFADTDTYIVTIETTTTDAPPDAAEITLTGFTACRGLGMVNFTSGTPPTYGIIHVYSGGDLGVDSYGSVIHFWKQ